MLYDADLWTGQIVQLLKDKNMYNDTIIIFSPDNGGVNDGNNWPSRGEKHTSWEGAMRVAAFVSGGYVPAAARGTTNDITFHIADWYPTICNLAGVDPTDDPPVAPLPIDPTDPTKDIYGEDSFPPVDGKDIWDMVVNPSSYEIDSAHKSLVLSKETLLRGKYKLVVAQPDPSTMHATSVNNGWKAKNGTWETSSDLEFPCNQYENRTNFKPCLFDLEADPSERINLSEQLPTVVHEMWKLLNDTYLTYYGVGRSPASLIGDCQPTCTKKKWNNLPGPECAVPGC